MAGGSTLQVIIPRKGSKYTYNMSSYISNIPYPISKITLPKSPKAASQVADTGIFTFPFIFSISFCSFSSKLSQKSLLRPLYNQFKWLSYLRCNAVMRNGGMTFTSALCFCVNIVWWVRLSHDIYTDGGLLFVNRPSRFLLLRHYLMTIIVSDTAQTIHNLRGR